MKLIREGFQEKVDYIPIFEKTMVMDQQRRWKTFQELENDLELAHSKYVFPNNRERMADGMDCPSIGIGA